MKEKEDVLLECKKDLEKIKEATYEFKSRVEGMELGIRCANKESTLCSPQCGVPILEGVGKPRDMIRKMEKVLGISSWIDNV